MSPSTEVKKKKKAGTPNKKKKSHTHFLYYQNQVVILIMTLHPTALCLFLISNIHLKVGLVIIFKRRCQLCMLRFGFVISGCHSLIKCSFPSSQIYLLLSAWQTCFHMLQTSPRRLGSICRLVFVFS